VEIFEWQDFHDCIQAYTAILEAATSDILL